MTTAPMTRPGIARIAHICLNARNLDASTAFYHGALGMPVKFTFARDGKRCGAYFEAGGQTFIEVFEHPEVVPSNTGIVHFCLEVEDMDAAVAALEAHGVRCTGRKLGCDQSHQVWLQDPDGTHIELHQYTPQSAQRVGGVVHVSW
jgi:catechol 2,3-dioxygenase-like lactoylglutathione lyase family enzyme